MHTSTSQLGKEIPWWLRCVLWSCWGRVKGKRREASSPLWQILALSRLMKCLKVNLLKELEFSGHMPAHSREVVCNGWGNNLVPRKRFASKPESGWVLGISSWCSQGNKNITEMKRAHFGRLQGRMLWHPSSLYETDLHPILWGSPTTLYTVFSSIWHWIIMICLLVCLFAGVWNPRRHGLCLIHLYTPSP